MIEGLLFSRHNNEYQSTPEWNGYVELKQALRQGDTEKVKSLIVSGVKVNADAGDKTHSPLCLAISLGCLDIAKLLIEKGASINFLTVNNETPLIIAVKIGKFDIADYILSVMDVEDSLNYKNNENLTLMHVACMRNKIELVKKFIEHGESKKNAVKKKSIYWPGFTPLHFAVQYQCIETVEFLLSCGADITIKNAKGLTPLHLAFMLEDGEMIDLILSYHKYEISNPVNSDGLSHFHIACTRNNVDVVHSFLIQRTHVNLEVPEKALSWSSFRPIDFAIYYECVDVIKLLLSFEACLQRNYQESIYLAYSTKNKKLIDLLLSRHVIETVDIDPSKMLNNYYLLYDMFSDLQRCKLTNKKPEQLDLFCWTNYTLLHVAVKIKSSDLVECFSSNSPSDIISKDASGKTPLHLAFENEQMEFVDLILANHESIAENPINNEGLSHFHISCTRNNLKVIQFFLLNGVDINSAIPINSKIWPGYTPLHLACEYKLKEVYVILLKKGANISVKNKAGLTAFDIAVSKLDTPRGEDDHLSIIEETLKLSSTMIDQDQVNAFDDRGFSLLHVYCLKNDEQKTDYLNLHPETINKRINWSKSTYFECAPLDLLHRYFCASLSYNDDFAILLIERGADIHFKNSKGEVVFYDLLSTCSELEDRISSFISEADLNYIHKDGRSYFHLACAQGYLQIAQYFIDQGIDINTRNVFKSPYYTYDIPLHLVVDHTFYVDYDLVETLTKLLLEKGADVNARNATLNTPLHIAAKSDNLNVLKLLLDYGADVNAVNLYCETPLHLACEDIDGYEKICLLLNYNADINVLTEYDQSPLKLFESALKSDIEYNVEELVVLLKHVKKLNMINYHVSQTIEQDYSIILITSEVADHYRENDFIEECTKEIDRLKDVHIDKYTSLYDVLLKSHNQMVFHSKNEKFKEMVESDEFYAQFPVYGFLIKNQFKQGLIKKPLLQDGRTSFQSLIIYSLPDSCVEHILQYLCNEDLENIILSQKNI